MKKMFLFLMITISLISAPRAIVFDFGGILIGSPNREAVAEFLKSSFKLTDKEFIEVNKERKKAMKAGQSGDEFWLQYAKAKEIVLSDHWHNEFQKVIWESIEVSHEMYALIDELKDEGLKVALLSNADPFLSKMIREFGLYHPFNPCLLSCEIGVEKPNPRAYSILLEKLKLSGEEVLFIDDRLENVLEAKRLGIDAILFESPKKIREEFVKRNLLDSEENECT